MELTKVENGFVLNYKGKKIIEHKKDNPFLLIGKGEGSFSMYRGNFKIKSKILKKEKPIDFKIKEVAKGYEVEFIFSTFGNVKVLIKEEERLNIEFIQQPKDVNRVYINIPSCKNEHVYGLGEQFSYLDLKGKNYPIWVREQGVGRNKKDPIKIVADLVDKAGGDYHTTFYPEPTFVSSSKYFCHVDDSSYMDFDFSKDNYHTIEIWSFPKQIVFGGEDNFINLLENLTDLLGRQSELPDWTYDGAIIGVQGGTDIALEKLKKCQDKGVLVNGIWAQDWEGKRITPFGKRLMWDFRWNKEMYPELDIKIKELNKNDVKFLGYINPYLAIEGKQFKEADENGYLVKNSTGETYRIDMGAFLAGIVDLTNEKAFEWYKNEIKINMIDFGLSGWMADFGEYLPTDAVLYSNESAEKIHNLYPMLWAKLNKEALEETGKKDDIFFFTRSGYSGTQKYSTMMWAGDQNVNWSLDDGLPSVIVSALSLAMTGYGLQHSDIGGYTTLFSMKRTKELFQRWAEFAAFTPLMRTHEGNRPDDNWQFDHDEETLLHFAKMTRVHKELKIYIKDLVRENSLKGIPVMRPLFIHYEQDEKAYITKYEYMFGKDILVAPVIKKGETKKDVYLPKDNWVNLFTGEENDGGIIKVACPIGVIPVFYRRDSKYSDLFKKIKDIK